VAHVFLEVLDAVLPLILAFWQKNVAYGVFSCFGKFKVTILYKEIMRYIYENSRAVSRPSIGAHRSPVLQLFENFERIVNNSIGCLAFQATYKSCATIVVFEFGPVKTLLFWHVFSNCFFNQLIDYPLPKIQLHAQGINSRAERQNEENNTFSLVPVHFEHLTNE